MTPLEIEIMLHYYCRCDDYRGGDLSAPAVKSALTNFVDNEFLEWRPAAADVRVVSDGPAYKIMERGRVYVEALKKVTWPVKSWTVPVGSIERSMPSSPESDAHYRGRVLSAISKLGTDDPQPADAANYNLALVATGQDLDDLGAPYDCPRRS